MSPFFSVATPSAASRVSNPQRIATHHMYSQHHHAMAPMRAFQTYSGGNQKQSASEALQSLLHSNLASSVAGMADRAATQSVEKVRRLSAAAVHAAAQALEQVPIRGRKSAEQTPTMPPSGYSPNTRLSSALEQASFETNGSQFPPNFQ